MAQLLVVRRPCVMKKTTPRDIQMCVAGAFALMGFYSIYWIPHYVTAKDMVPIISHFWGALALPLGIGIVTGSKRAMLLTQIYLWMELATGCVGIPIICYYFPTNAAHMIWRSGPDIIISAILLGLIFWSRSERFRHEPDA